MGELIGKGLSPWYANLPLNTELRSNHQFQSFIMALVNQAENKKHPNLFIVGAPKCGTTAMYTYLQQHPEVFMSPVKEPYYFGNDMIFYRLQRKTQAEYLTLFGAARDEKVLGEASVTYLASTSAAEEIYAFNRSAKIIIMLRNPVEMVYSLHSQLLFTETEDIANFEAALQAEEDRKLLKRIPPRCTIVNFLYYREFATYAPQVTRYLHRFNSNQVKIIIYDDLKADTKKTYCDTLRFLEVNSNLEPEEYAVVNRNKVKRHQWLRTSLRQPLVLEIGRRLVSSRTKRQNIAKRFNSLTIQHRKRPPMTDEIKTALQEYFLSDVKKLSKMLDRDLTHWCKRS